MRLPVPPSGFPARNLGRLPVAGWLLLLTLLGLIGAPRAQAELVYDNSFNNLGVFLTEDGEFGDEIDFGGTARVLSSIGISVVGETNLPAGVTGRLRIYQMDGPVLPTTPPVRTPGVLIYQSEDFPVQAGVFPLRIRDLAVPVPNRVAWTIEFFGAGILPGRRAGLQVYHPPVVGRSFRDYWVRTPTGFQLYLLNSGFPASFAAQFEALPDPPIVLTPTPQPDGSVAIRLEGPIGTEHLLEFSSQTNEWRTLAYLSLGTNAVANFTDPAPDAASRRVYRSRPTPNPGQTCVIERMVARPDGAAVLRISGSRNTRHMLEVSSDLTHWESLDLVRLQGIPVEYVDPLAASSPTPRFYRTRYSNEAEPLYRIGSITRQPDRSMVIQCTRVYGPTTVLMQASTDLVRWVPIGSVRFDSVNATFTDRGAITLQRRFYRLVAN